MAPKPNADAAKHNGSNGKTAASTTATQNPYAPSVPIPVYRELAAELQATKAMLESLNAQNQALARQNALLKKEVQTIVQSALHLQNMMTPPTSVQSPEKPVVSPLPPAIAPIPSSNGVHESSAPRLSDRPIPSSELASTLPPPASARNGRTGVIDPAPTVAVNPSELPPIEDSDTFFTEQQNTPQSIEKTPRQMSGLWLLLLVLVIMVTAFTAGFLVMRPILLKNNQ